MPGMSAWQFEIDDVISTYQHKLWDHTAVFVGIAEQSRIFAVAAGITILVQSDANQAIRLGHNTGLLRTCVRLVAEVQTVLDGHASPSDFAGEVGTGNTIEEGRDGRAGAAQDGRVEFVAACRRDDDEDVAVGVLGENVFAAWHGGGW